MSSRYIGRNVIQMLSLVVLVAIFSLSLAGVANAHSVQQPTVTKTGVQAEVFIPLNSENQISATISNALKQTSPNVLKATQEAYAASLKHPEKVQVETYTINQLNSSSVAGVNPFLNIPGIGQLTIRVYLFAFVPYGMALFLPLQTARNLLGIGTAAAAAITAAIVSANHNLAPFAAVIGAVLANILNSLSNYVINTCGEAGGGFTVNFVVAVPVPYCGTIPVFPL